MQHTFYALFPDARSAERALIALVLIEGEHENCRVYIDKSQFKQDLPLTATSARRAGINGALIGGPLGAILLFLLSGPLGFAVGSVLSSTLFGLIGGLALGGLGGVLVGVGEPDLELDPLAELVKTGKVIVTVESPSLRAHEVAEEVARSLGAEVHRHRTVGYKAGAIDKGFESPAMNEVKTT